MKTMKAAVVHRPMHWSVDDVPVPAVPVGGMLLRVRACGLCGSDLRTLRSGHKKITFPWILGHEICGDVVELGEGYRGAWKVGRRLSVGPLAYDPSDPQTVAGRPELATDVREIGQAWHGGLAEFIAIPREAVELGNIVSAPEGLDPEYAAVVEPASSVVHAQERAAVGLGDVVLVMGAGPIGCLHVAVARARGASKVFLADVNAERLAAAEVFEPDATLDVNSPEFATDVTRLSGGLGPSVVVTAAPSGAAQVTAVEIARKGGRVVLFGGLPHDSSTPDVDMNRVHYHNLTLIGVSIFAPRHFRTALELIADGRIPVKKLVTHRFPLAEFDTGARIALDGRALKVVFLP